VLTYATGAELLADIPQAACFIIDYRLPGMSGLDLLAEIRRRRIRSPAILITTQPSAAVRHRAATSGTVLIEKPPGRTVQEVDALIAAAEQSGRPVPHQVAFNRRFVPIVAEARRRLAAVGPPSAIQHLHYEMTRVDRRDPDFSTTAIHGLDAVRFLGGADYAQARFRYHEQPALGPGVAHMFVDAVLTSGATAHLAFCPTAGAVVERATVHAGGHTFFLRIPMWGPLDAPGHLQHVDRGQVVADLAGDRLGGASDACVLGGFFGEYAAFLGDLAAGRTPSPSLRECRQSVEIAECLRRRDEEFRA